MCNQSNRTSALCSHVDVGRISNLDVVVCHVCCSQSAKAAEQTESNTQSRYAIPCCTVLSSFMSARDCISQTNQDIQQWHSSQIRAGSLDSSSCCYAGSIMFTVLMRVHGSNIRGNMDTSRPGMGPKDPIAPQTEASPRPAFLVVSRMLQVIAAVQSSTSPCSSISTLTPYAVP